MIKTVTISDGRTVELVDLDALTPDQTTQLATACADVLIRSGMIRNDAGLSGPQLLQFLSELGDHLARQAEETAADDGVITIRGTLGEISSKRGLRFVAISVDEPYDHEARVTIEALPGQDDDALTEALCDLPAGELVLRTRMVDGTPTCTTDDIRPAPVVGDDFDADPAAYDAKAAAMKPNGDPLRD